MSNCVLTGQHCGQYGRPTLLNGLYFVSLGVRNFDSKLLRETGKDCIVGRKKNANLLYGHDDFNRVQAVKRQVICKGSRSRNLENVST